MTDREKLIDLLEEINVTADEDCGIDRHTGGRVIDIHGAEWVADHLIANGVIVLPCKVGDTVYEVRNNTDACIDCRYRYCGFNEEWCENNGFREYPTIASKPLCEKQFMEVVEFVPTAEWIFLYSNNFGKTVFLNREEAEAALPEPPKGD